MCTIKLKFPVWKSYLQDHVCKADSHFSEYMRAVKRATVEQNVSLDDSLVKVMPLSDNMLLEVVDIVDPGTVDLSLQNTQIQLLWV